MSGGRQEAVLGSAGHRRGLEADTKRAHHDTDLLTKAKAFNTAFMAIFVPFCSHFWIPSPLPTFCCCHSFHILVRFINPTRKEIKIKQHFGLYLSVEIISAIMWRE